MEDASYQIMSMAADLLCTFLLKLFIHSRKRLYSHGGCRIRSAASHSVCITETGAEGLLLKHYFQMPAGSFKGIHDFVEGGNTHLSREAVASSVFLGWKRDI